MGRKESGKKETFSKVGKKEKKVFFRLSLSLFSSPFRGQERKCGRWDTFRTSG